jgi:hypothetical protein
LLTWISTCWILDAMIGTIFRIVINLIRVAMMNRADLVIENTGLRQQLAVLKSKHPRPKLRPADRVFWTALGSAWPREESSLSTSRRLDDTDGPCFFTQQVDT